MLRSLILLVNCTPCEHQSQFDKILDNRVSLFVLYSSRARLVPACPAYSRFPRVYLTPQRHRDLVAAEMPWVGRQHDVSLIHSTPLHILCLSSKVFFRAGLEVIKADSVYANELCDVKKPSTSTHPCAICMVARSDLGKPEVAELRTSAQITDALQEISAATTASERHAIGKRTGVVLRGKQPNPYRLIASVDTVTQIPPDVFHQDALVRRS